MVHCETLSLHPLLPLPSPSPPPPLLLPFPPQYNSSSCSNSSVCTACLKHSVTSFLIPDALLFVSYLYALYIFRFSEPEYLQMLTQTVSPLEGNDTLGALASSHTRSQVWVWWVCGCAGVYVLTVWAGDCVCVVCGGPVAPGLSFLLMASSHRCFLDRHPMQASQGRRNSFTLSGTHSAKPNGGQVYEFTPHLAISSPFPPPFPSQSPPPSLSSSLPSSSPSDSSCCWVLCGWSPH